MGITVKEVELMQLLAAASDLQVKGLSEMHRDKRTKPQISPIEPTKSMHQISKTTEMEGRLKRKEEVQTLRNPDLDSLDVLKRHHGVQAVKIAKMDSCIDSTNVKAENMNKGNSLIHPDQLIAEEELTNLSTNDVEQLDYPEGVGEFDPSDYPEESNYFNFENQAPPVNQKVKKVTGK